MMKLEIDLSNWLYAQPLRVEGVLDIEAVYHLRQLAASIRVASTRGEFRGDAGLWEQVTIALEAKAHQLQPLPTLKEK